MASDIFERHKISGQFTGRQLSTSAPAGEFIYALFYDHFPDRQSLEEGPDEVEFYVGRTVDPARRLQQHRNEAKRGYLDKDRFIREELVAKGIEWSLRVVQEVAAEDHRPWEYWVVIEYIRAGRLLMNMRFGDLKHLSNANIRQLANDRQGVRDVDDVQRVIGDEARKAPSAGSSASLKVQERALFKCLRWLRHEGADPDDPDTSIWNLGADSEEISADRYMSRRALAIELARRRQQKTPEQLETTRKLHALLLGGVGDDELAKMRANPKNKWFWDEHAALSGGGY